MIEARLYAAGMVDWDQMLDCEGLLCPLPVLRARKRLIAMAPGEVLCVRATDAMAAVDLPHFCGQAGHVYLGMREEGGVSLHLIRVGGQAGAG
jgi:tRNA 2-thiouridine synthesizing protein A